MKETKELYGFLWSKEKNYLPGISKSHYHSMQDVISEKIVRGKLGVEIGSGNGHDTFVMSKENPDVKIVSMDLSDGIHNAKKLVENLGNVCILKGSALNIPLKDGLFDFAYSFGVLHHTENPTKGLREIKKILKKDAPVFLYLYEDHSENLLKYYLLKIITVFRKVTTNIPHKLLYPFCFFLSPLVFLLFSCPAKIFGRFDITRKISGKLPFNFGSTPFSLTGDLYDRFGAPIEERYSRSGAMNLLKNEDFYNIRITRLVDTAGWVLWGVKGS